MNEKEFSDILGLGKVSREVLRRSVFPFLPLSEEPSLDGGFIQMKGRMVISHSLSIGVPLESLGFFAFHYAASNVACLFAQPRHLIIGIYLPLRTKENDLRIITKGLGEEARRYSVKIVAGQTATYYGLEMPLIASTCLGEPVKEPQRPREGDSVVVIGAVGGEALWLKALSEGINADRWREFTPLPAALRLQEIEGVRLMHDVSEGGVKGAVKEIAEALKVGIEIDSRRIPYVDGVKKLNQDILRAPTYGTLVAIVKPDAADEALRVCEEMNRPCAVVGAVRGEAIARVDGVEIEEFRRTALDELYGSFRPRDEILDGLREALKALEKEPKISKLIPQVGTNMAYAKPGAVSIGEVAGLSGRVIVSMGQPKACGEVVYGGSLHMASVALAASRLRPRIRAAVNIRGGDDISKALREMGLSVCTLPETLAEGACPAAVYIEQTGKICDAYAHPGAFGVEPTTTIISETPGRLLKILVELGSRV